MKVISGEVHLLLISLAKRVNPSYPNWWSPRDKDGNWLDVGLNRCLICDEVHGYSMSEHVSTHLKEKGLLVFL